jgi:PPOX class probable F420-dependent enzyme
MSFTVANVSDVSEGVKPGQFTVEREDEGQRLDEIDAIYRHLMDEPVTAIIAVMGKDGRPNLTPVWFDYTADRIRVNLAAHRLKVQALRREPRFTMTLMNPSNPYHWMTFKATVTKEIHEDDPAEGHLATESIDRCWTKYTGAEPPYGLRDPEGNERRVLFEARVDRIVTFGKP